MAANLRAFLREIDTASQANRIAFVDSLKSLLMGIGGSDASRAVTVADLLVRRQFPQVPIQQLTRYESGVATALASGPGVNQVSSSSSPLLIKHLYSWDSDVYSNSGWQIIYSPSTDAFDNPGRPGTVSGRTIVETVAGPSITLDPKYRQVDLLYWLNGTPPSGQSTNPVRMNINLFQVDPYLLALGDFDYTWDIHWDILNTSGTSTYNIAMYLSVLAYDRPSVINPLDPGFPGNISQAGSYALYVGSLTHPQEIKGRGVLRVVRQAGLVYLGYTPIPYAPLS